VTNLYRERTIKYFLNKTVSYNQASGTNVHVHVSHYYDTRETDDAETGLGDAGLNKHIIP